MTPAPPLLTKAREYLMLDASQLEQLAESLTPAVGESVHQICSRVRAGGKLVLTGIGKSYHIASKVASTFTSTGTPAVVLHPAEAPHGDLGILQDGDTVLLLSYSGESREVLQLIPFLKRADVTLICITGTPDNSLARAADIALLAPIEREACPFNLAPTTSALLTLALCDTLAMLVQEELGFTMEHYRQLHPGGAIGDSLTLTVHDIMRTGDRLPSCEIGSTVHDAVLVMTRCKAGAVGILNPDRSLAGIFTDGDLRRALTKTTSPMDTALLDVMTSSPITLMPTASATEALALFEQHMIDDLLVVDDENRLVGIVDLQDIPKLKVFKES